MRKALPWLSAVAILHLVVGLPALLGEGPLFVSGLVTAAIQPLSAALIFAAGLQLHRGLRPHGALIMALSAFYVFCGLMPPLLMWSPEGLMVSFGVAAMLGPLVGAGLFVLLAAAVNQLTPLDRPTPKVAWAIGAAFPALGAAGLLLAGVVQEEWALALWVAFPQLATALAVLLLRTHLKASPRERDLVDAVIHTPALRDFELVPHSHPVGVRCTLSIPQVPFKRAEGAGVKLQNPVLDGLLALDSDSPTALAKQLSGHEATVLAVLHAWPLSEILDGHLHWEATLDQIHDKGPDPAQTLRQVQQDLRSFQALFEDTLPTRGASEALLQGFQPKG